MKKVQFAIATAFLTLVACAGAADAACKSKYYTGTDVDPIWWEGRNNARANWSDKVANTIGTRWSRWSKAKNANDTCDWLPTQGVNYCVARARPCK
jgi:hypothetical protein